MRYLNPFTIWLNGWNWSGYSDRKEYLASLIWLYVPFLLAAFALLPGLNQGTLFAVGILAFAALLVPNLGYRLRRLNDAGYSGWWALLALVPFVTILFAIGVLLLKSAPRPVIARWRWWGRLATCVVGVLLLLRMLYAPYDIISGSMKPALLPGDYVFATRIREPEPGDIVVFRHPVQNSDYVKRVIAVGGDTLQMSAGQVLLNGVALEDLPMPDYQEVMEQQGVTRTIPLCRIDQSASSNICLKSQSRQYLPNGVHFPILSTTDNSTVDNTEVFVVPDGHLFVMGDNRDNSADSRMQTGSLSMGFVPVQNVKHKVQFVVYSISRGTKTGTFLRSDRWFKWVR